MSGSSGMRVGSLQPPQPPGSRLRGGGRLTSLTLPARESSPPRPPPLSGVLPPSPPAPRRSFSQGAPWFPPPRPSPGVPLLTPVRSGVGARCLLAVGGRGRLHL